MFDLTDYRLIIGSDFNAVWNHAIDRSTSTEGSEQRLASIALKKWAQDGALIDLWRLTHPSSKDFSFFSSRHQSFSRIDYLFSSRDLLKNISIDMIQLSALSDHKAIICRAELSAARNRASRWRFNTSLLQMAKRAGFQTP